jgi:hypothetical protein
MIGRIGSIDPGRTDDELRDARFESRDVGASVHSKRAAGDEAPTHAGGRGNGLSCACTR